MQRERGRVPVYEIHDPADSAPIALGLSAITEGAGQ
jgi:hypothetical protein